jgi:opacity protein-like surface antigen
MDMRYAGLAIAALVTVSGAFSAKAADAFKLPSFDSQSVIPTEEIGSGWYIRGDIGFGLAQDPEVSYTGAPTTVVSNGRMENNLPFGIGAGYQINSFLRLDTTVEWMGRNRFSWTLGGTSCYGTTCLIDPTSPPDEANVSFIPVLANAYFDLGTYGGLTPYVGAGLGAAYYTVDGLTWNYSTATTTGPTPTTATSNYIFDEGSGFALAAAAMAGAAYSIDNRLQLDLGYRYLWIEKAEGGIARLRNVETSGPTTTTTLENGDGKVRFKNIQSHQVRAGLRYFLN